MVKKILTIANWKKTYYYLKKNGVRQALLAAMERLEKSENDAYQYIPPSEEELEQQRVQSRNAEILFSILVPVYCTPEKYFKEMINSVLQQTYPNWELLLADASPERDLEKLAADFNDKRVRYVKLAENKGISANTNAVLTLAEGAYIGLLDHDDVLTPDALYEVYQAIKECEKAGKKAALIYTDEDKGDGEMQSFYDVNHKPAFDWDYLCSNNYICHFTVMEAGLMKQLGFRPDFDGAQDFDLVLRVAAYIMSKDRNDYQDLQVLNIPKVAYHWRCHRASTAVNPQSKLYAYEAGKRAVEATLASRGIAADVEHSRHLGFYNVHYEDIFRDRPEVGMVAGPVYRKGRIAGGARGADGTLLYGGLRKGFSGGHLHRAAVWQQCAQADLANAICREDVLAEFLKTQPKGSMELLLYGKGAETDRLRAAWAKYLHDRAMLILYNPNME